MPEAQGPDECGVGGDVGIGDVPLSPARQKYHSMEPGRAKVLFVVVVVVITNIAVVVVVVVVVGVVIA